MGPFSETPQISAKWVKQVVAADSVAVLVVKAVVAAVGVVAEAGAVVEDAAEGPRRERRNGYPSLSLVVLSRMERSRAWRRSTCSPCLSRSVRSLTLSCPLEP